MTAQSRSEKIAAYGSAYETLVAGLEDFPKEMWHFRDEHGCWSIHEHLVHITDSEVNSYIRCRRLIAEPGEPLMAYDENAWASGLRYTDRSAGGALDLFRILRQQTYDLIKTAPELTWANACYHPENGDMTLDDWLDVYAVHISEHLEYMRENYHAWLASV